MGFSISDLLAYDPLFAQYLIVANRVPPFDKCYQVLIHFQCPTVTEIVIHQMASQGKQLLGNQALAKVIRYWFVYVKVLVYQ